MTDMRDKLAQIISDDRFYGGPLHIADAIIAALPDMVEPLGWEDHPLNGEPVLSRALVQGGGYFICEDNDDFTGAYLDFVSCDNVRWWQHVRSTSTNLMENWRDDDIAPLKAVAEAHHRAAIMAALGVNT